MAIPLSTLLPALLFGLATAAGALWAIREVEARRRRRHMLRQLHRFTAAAGPAAPSATELLRRATPEGGWVRGGLLRPAPIAASLERLLEQAGLPWTARGVVYSAVGFGIVAASLAWLVTASPSATMVALLLGGLVPLLHVKRKRAARLRKVEEQLPETIDLLGRSIRAGHSVFNGLRLVAEEGSDPIASEFRRVFDEQRYGMPLEESLLGLARRLDLVDVRVMVVAILIQREVGGNLAEILDKLSSLIRTRFHLRRQLQVYTAQGRLSGVVLGALPIAMGGIIFMMSPEYILPLFQLPAGRMMLFAAVGMQLVGYFWISRILRIDF